MQQLKTVQFHEVNFLIGVMDYSLPLILYTTDTDLFWKLRVFDRFTHSSLF